jgi:hypothetical protein
MFLQEEYNAELGCYIKWIQGNPEEKIEKMYSMSAFHFFDNNIGYVEHYEYQKYAEYLNLTVRSIIENSPDWYVRIYTDTSILTDLNGESNKWKEILDNFSDESRIQILCIKMPDYYSETNHNHQGLLPVLFRYLTLFDPNVSICLFRDIDNIWTEQHDYFTNQWLSGTEDICVFLNTNYKRQQICDLTPTDVVLEEKYYCTLLSGMWNIRKSFGYIFPFDIWQKMFAYIENYTDFVNNPEYKTYKYFGIRFTYGFDELALTRIVLPIFMDMGLTFYAIPIKIYDLDSLNCLFDDPILKKFFDLMSDRQTMSIVKQIALNNYWHMNTENEGLSEYILCILINIYFNIIIGKSSYKNEKFISALQNKIYPVPILMGLGLFTFKNLNRYNWYPIQNVKSTGGIDVVKKFIDQNLRLTLEDFTANSDLSNNGDGPINPYSI